MEPTLKPKTVDGTLLGAVQPSIYANGFVCGHSATDAFIIFQLNNTPISEMHCSFESLKSLSEALIKTISHVEGKLNRPLQTHHELEALFSNGNNSE
jgi:hypothetical protein